MQERVIENLQLSADRCLDLTEWQAERLLKNKKTQEHCYEEESLVQRKACVLQAVFSRICKDSAQSMLKCVRQYQKMPKNRVPSNACEGELISFIQCAEKLSLIPLANQEVI